MKDHMTSVAATNHLQENHCPETGVNYFNVTDKCVDMVTEITPVMMTTLASWMMQNQSDICSIDFEDPNTCDMCDTEIDFRISQILAEAWITAQKNRLFGDEDFKENAF